jgi:hypothetical protein
MSVGSTLTVTGKTTLDDTLNLKYTDGLTTPLILANSDLTGEGEEASAILIEVERGTAPNVRIQWNEASDVFEVEGVLSSKSGFQVGTDATAPKVAISTGGVLSFTDASQGAILFNSDLAGGANPENTDDFGITVNRGVLTDAKLYWDESATRWQFETGNVAIQNSLVVDSDAGAGGGVITISAGQITSDSGTLSLNTNVLATTGSVNISNNELILDSDNGNNRATITSSLGTIWFDNENLTTSGNISTTGTGALSVAGTSTLFGGVTLNGANLTINNGLDPLVNKFTVVASSGNTNIEGTLVVKSTTTLHNTLVANADSAVDLGTNAVRWRDIYSDGLTLTDNASIGGTLGVTGISTLTGLLNANGGIAVDGTAFTVADTTGNVVTEGTLVVKSTTELDGNVSIKNGFGGATTFAVTAASGNTSISGTLGVAKTTTINSADGSADFIVQNNGVSKFVVDGEAGNTTTQGTMTIVGNTEVTTGNLTVTQGNLVVTAGGLTLTAGGVSATAAASSFGAVSATSFSQSGATLTLVSGGGAATDAFVSVERGATDAQIKWNETSDKWQVRDVSDGTFYNIVDTNTTLFSLNAGGNNKNFILSDGADTLTISGSGGVSVAHAGNGTVALSLSDSISITSDLTVGGTATFNGATMRLVDTLLYMGLNNASTANNIGFYGQYKTVGDVTQYAGLAYRPLSDKFVLFGSETGLSSTEVSIAPTDSELTSLDLKTLVAVSGVSVKSSSDDTSAKTALLLNSDQTGTPAATEDVSIEVERGDSTNAKITWDEGEDRWMADNGTGTSYGVITAKASEGARYSCVEPTFVTNAYTLSAPTAYENKHAYFLDNGGTAGTLNLFALSGTTYDGYVLQLINKGTNTITVDGDGAQTIGGEATKDISAGATLSLIAYGTAWFII